MVIVLTAAWALADFGIGDGSISVMSSPPASGRAPTCPSDTGNGGAGCRPVSRHSSSDLQVCVSVQVGESASPS